MEGNVAFRNTFGKDPHYLFSAPGRTELSGNHTDHQHGRVLAAAVNLETLAWVSEADEPRLCVQSEGYPMCTVELSSLSAREEERNTTASLVRGVAARFAEKGARLRGLDFYVTSTVLPGSGLSSSAAFEVLIGTVLNTLCFEGRCTPVEVAQIGQWAENNYFGKPCGLMDQTASSVGSVIGIDFKDPAQPVVERVDFSLEAAGYALCIIDSGASHADLTGEYAAIPAEMRQVAELFGKQFLRDVDPASFYADLKRVREAAGDRAVLRAMHFFAENERVYNQIEALKNNDFPAFLRLAAESGNSSRMLLQNVTPAGQCVHQDVAFALDLASYLLRGKGAVRVHGGGFAGTVQAFVPLDMLSAFKTELERVLGEGSCHVLSFRSEGGYLVKTFG